MNVVSPGMPRYWTALSSTSKSSLVTGMLFLNFSGIFCLICLKWARPWQWSWSLLNPEISVTFSHSVEDLLRLFFFFFPWGFLKRDKFWKAQDGKSELFQQISHPKSQTDVQLMGARVPTLVNAQWITNSWSSEVPKSVPRKTHLCVLHFPVPIEGREISSCEILTLGVQSPL